MAEGKTAVKGKLSLPSTFLRRAEQQGPNQLELTTSLQGIAINLPRLMVKPLSKRVN